MSVRRGGDAADVPQEQREQGQTLLRLPEVPETATLQVVAWHFTSNTLVLTPHDSFFRWESDNAVETEAPLCTRHQKKCLVRRVKQGVNSGRLFYTCSLPDYEDTCGFQKWIENPQEQNKIDISVTNRMSISDIANLFLTFL